MSVCNVRNIVKEYENLLSKNERVLLAGHLQHVHVNAKMSSFYVLSSNQQYGYAFARKDVEIEDQSLFSYLDLSAIDCIYQTNSHSLQLAILDSIWNCELDCTQKFSLGSSSLKEREQERCYRIATHLISQCKHLDTKPTVFMIGLFRSLQYYLKTMGFQVYCKDDDLGLDFPASCDLESLIFQSILIASGSYLTYPNYKVIQSLAAQSAYSVLIAQTCHNMIEMHLKDGFSAIFSESFPPYSLCKSEISVYEL
jgi:hypothetical protein